MTTKNLNEELDAVSAIGSRLGFINTAIPTESASGMCGKYKLLANGEKVLDCTRLDSIDLSGYGLVHEICARNIKRYGTAAEASQMVMQNAVTCQLEQKIAAIYGASGSLLFLSGFDANVNAISALAARTRIPHLTAHMRALFGHDASAKRFRGYPTKFFVDSESHYSVVASLRQMQNYLGRECIGIHMFASGNYDQLEHCLLQPTDAIKIIVSDTISSTTGRIFDMTTLCRIADLYDALLYLDEAHAIGAYGPSGFGIVDELGLANHYASRLIIMGTFTKAIAQVGAFVSVPYASMGDFLRSASPGYIFSAPIPLYIAASLLEIFDIVAGRYGQENRKKLAHLSERLRTGLKEGGFDTLGSQSHIVSILCGTEGEGVRVRQGLLEKGFLVSFFEYPAVRHDQSIIRFSVCSDMTEEEIDNFVTALACVYKK